jgi:membrane fusion protein (multidrug efflux system)
VAIAVLAVLMVIAAGILWWLHARQFESTDDAFIDAHTVAISPQVAGAISELNVNDNQIVKAGTVLARIDDAIYASQLAQAKAQVEQLQANIANLAAQLDAQHPRIDQANKQAAEAQAALAFSQQENTRYVELVKTGAGTEQRAQQAASDLTQKQAAFAGAQANAVTAQKQLLLLQTQRGAADAQLKSAEAGQKAGGNQTLIFDHHRAGRRASHQAFACERHISPARTKHHDVRASGSLGYGQLQGDAT